jgi:hypothetical protein
MHEALVAVALIMGVLWCVATSIEIQITRKTDLVVRCKDCAVPHNRWTGCPKMNGTVMPPDGFCSFGERKADHDG